MNAAFGEHSRVSPSPCADNPGSQRAQMLSLIRRALGGLHLACARLMLTSRSIYPCDLACHGVEAADRLCEACVTLFGVYAAVISLVFDGTNTGTLGRAVHSHAYAANCRPRAYRWPARPACRVPPSGPATPTRRRSSQRRRRPDAPPCKAGSVLSCIWSPKHTRGGRRSRSSQNAWSPEQPHTAFWHPGLRWPGSGESAVPMWLSLDGRLREQASRSAPRQLRRHCGG